MICEHESAWVVATTLSIAIQRLQCQATVEIVIWTPFYRWLMNVMILKLNCLILFMIRKLALQLSGPLRMLPKLLIGQLSVDIKAIWSRCAGKQMEKLENLLLQEKD